MLPPHAPLSLSPTAAMEMCKQVPVAGTSARDLLPKEGARNLVQPRFQKLYAQTLALSDKELERAALVNHEEYKDVFDPSGLVASQKAER